MAIHLALALAAAVTTPAPKPELTRAIDAYVAPYVAHDAFGGVILAARGGEVLFEKGYGPANAEFGVPNGPDTRFAIASITKRFTFVILERLFAEKKLGPDDPLAKWVPNFPSADRITIRHLMTHRSGVRDPEALRGRVRVNLTSADVVRAIAASPLASAPGEVFSYTTANYAILGHVIERVTGKTYAQVVKQYVYDPAGMRDSGELTTTSVVPRLATGYMPDPFGRGLSVCGPEDTSWKIGGGSSYSTARDLMRFARALHDGTLVPKSIVAEELAGSKLFDRRVLVSQGSFPGAGANLLHFVDDDVTVVVLTNNYATVAGTIAEDVAALLFERPPRNPAVTLAANPRPADPRLAGKYRVAGRPWTFTVELRDGRVIAAWTPVRVTAMLPMGDDRWFEPLDWAVLELRLDESGKLAKGSFTLPGQEPLAVVRE